MSRRPPNRPRQNKGFKKEPKIKNITLILTGNGLYPQRQKIKGERTHRPYYNFQSPEGLDKVFGPTYLVKQLRETGKYIEITVNILAPPQVFDHPTTDKGYNPNTMMTLHGAINEVEYRDLPDRGATFANLCKLHSVDDWLDSLKLGNDGDANNKSPLIGDDEDYDRVVISEILVIGLNCSGTNGKSLPKVLNRIGTQFPDMQINIVDINETGNQESYLYSRTRIEKSRMKRIVQDSHAYLKGRLRNELRGSFKHIKTIIGNPNPEITSQIMNDCFTTTSNDGSDVRMMKPCPTSDDVVANVYRWMVQDNGYQIPVDDTTNTLVKTRSQKKALMPPSPAPPRTSSVSSRKRKRNSKGAFAAKKKTAHLGKSNRGRPRSTPAAIVDDDDRKLSARPSRRTSLTPRDPCTSFRSAAVGNNDEFWEGPPDEAGIDWPTGWTKRIIKRNCSQGSKGKKSDTYWYTPDKEQRFDRLSKVRDFLKQSKSTSPSASKKNPPPALSGSSSTGYHATAAASAKRAMQPCHSLTGDATTPTGRRPGSGNRVARNLSVVDSRGTTSLSPNSRISPRCGASSCIPNSTAASTSNILRDPCTPSNSDEVINEEISTLAIEDKSKEFATEKPASSEPTEMSTATTAAMMNMCPRNDNAANKLTTKFAGKTAGDADEQAAGEEISAASMNLQDAPATKSRAAPVDAEHHEVLLSTPTDDDDFPDPMDLDDEGREDPVESEAVNPSVPLPYVLPADGIYNAPDHVPKATTVASDEENRDPATTTLNSTTATKIRQNSSFKNMTYEGPPKPNTKVKKWPLGWVQRSFKRRNGASYHMWYSSDKQIFTSLKSVQEYFYKNPRMVPKAFVSVPLTEQPPVDLQIIKHDPWAWLNATKQYGEIQPSLNGMAKAELQPEDVLYGGGRTGYGHVGNTQYRLLVDVYAPLYSKSDTAIRKSIAKCVVYTVRRMGGGFLQSDNNYDVFVDVGNDKAYTKTLKALSVSIVPIVKKRKVETNATSDVTIASKEQKPTPRDCAAASNCEADKCASVETYCKSLKADDNVIVNISEGQQDEHPESNFFVAQVPDGPSQSKETDSSQRDKGVNAN